MLENRNELSSAAASARTVFWAVIFAIGFAFVEASVVIYLRATFYPQGFALPLAAPQGQFIGIEMGREAATLVILAAISALAAIRRWERFAYFLIVFGVWDIFYYVWLKVLSGWPAGLGDWDVLFLLPLPWLGPVIAPLAISLLMIVIGFSILRATAANRRPILRAASWVAGAAGTVVILYSFMYDTSASIHGEMPRPYPYALLGAGLILWAAAYVFAYRRRGT